MKQRLERSHNCFFGIHGLQTTRESWTVDGSGFESCVRLDRTGRLIRSRYGGEKKT